LVGAWSSPPPSIKRHDFGGLRPGDDGADALGRCAQGVVEKVRVSTCCRRLRVAKQTANYMQTQSGTGQLGGIAMSQIVNSQPNNACRFAYLRPISFQAGAMPGRAGTGKNKFCAPVTLAD